MLESYDQFVLLQQRGCAYVNCNEAMATSQLFVALPEAMRRCRVLAVKEHGEPVSSRARTSMPEVAVAPLKMRALVQLLSSMEIVPPGRSGPNSAR